jgi:uncharacterized protein DUF4202
MSTESADMGLRFGEAIRQFDEANSTDPTRVTVAGGSEGRELVYARWLTEWVLRLEPNASEQLLLAARCQHLCRWEIPRDSHPMTRIGYLQWREQLKKLHARKAGEILKAVGYEEEVIARVQQLVQKKNFPNDPEGRVLEDGLCLVFLEHQFAELADKHTKEKMISVLRKTWKKMTAKGQEAALTLCYSARARELLDLALNP